MQIPKGYWENETNQREFIEYLEEEGEMRDERGERGGWSAVRENRGCTGVPLIDIGLQSRR